MKKIVLIMLILSILTGCNKKQEQQNEVIDEKKEIEQPKEEDKYVDTNPIELSFYMYYDKNTNRQRLTEYKTPFVIGQDLCSLEIYYTKDETLAINNQKTLWNQYYQNYNNIDAYKIGYKISFTTVNNENISKYILSPKDTDAVFNFIQIYLYDDIHVQDGAWYSHITEEEYNENTLLTSIKLTGSDYTNQIASDITLEVFTYDANDFDEKGNYLGNSKASIIISRA